MHRRKLLLSGACLLLALVLAATGTFAWLSKEEPANDAYTALSDFQVEGILSFAGQENVVTGDSVLIPVSFAGDQPNYIGNMKYVVRYTGVSPACVRVRVLEQWVTASTNEIMPASFLKYAVSNDVRTIPSTDTALTTLPAAGPGTDALAQPGAWVDNRAADYCYYYSVPVQPKQLTTPAGEGKAVAVGEGTVELTLFEQTAANTAAMIEGIDPSDTQLMLLIEVEAVQPNRFREFWHIDALPAP